MTKIRFIAAISAVLMALSVFSFTAYAEQEHQEQPVATEPGGGGETPAPSPTEEPYVPDDPVSTEAPSAARALTRQLSPATCTAKTAQDLCP